MAANPSELANRGEAREGTAGTGRHKCRTRLAQIIGEAVGRLTTATLRARAGARQGDARDWPDVSIPTATMSIGRSKTDAGIREVDIPLGALEELIEWRARRPVYEGEDDPVFVSVPVNGRPVARQTRRNVEERWKDAIRRANERLTELGIEPISERSPRTSLRRTTRAAVRLRDDPSTSPSSWARRHEPDLPHLPAAVKRRAKLSG